MDEQTRADELRDDRIWHGADESHAPNASPAEVDEAIASSTEGVDTEISPPRRGDGTEEEERRGLLKETEGLGRGTKLASNCDRDGLRCFGKNFGSIPTSFYTMVLPVMVRCALASFAFFRWGSSPQLVCCICRWSRVCWTPCRPCPCCGSSRTTCWCHRRPPFVSPALLFALSPWFCLCAHVP